MASRFAFGSFKRWLGTRARVGSQGNRDVTNAGLLLQQTPARRDLHEFKVSRRKLNPSMTGRIDLGTLKMGVHVHKLREKRLAFGLGHGWDSKLYKEHGYRAGRAV